MRKLLILLVLLASGLLWAGTAGAAPGDLVGTVHFSQDCGSGLGVGIAYDGAGHLWVSCAFSDPDLLRADATTGVIDQTYNISNGIGSLAYDATRNGLWAGWGGQPAGTVMFIQLDATKNVSGSNVAFVAPQDVVCGLDDGMGFDATDDSLYISDDCSTVIHQHTTAGVPIRDLPWAGNACYNSGVAIGGSLLFEGSDGCSHVWVVDKVTNAPAFDFSTAVAGDPNFRDEGLTCDTETFAPTQVMWSKEAYSPNRAAAFEIPKDTCGIGGQPPGPGPPANLTLTPATATNRVGQQHCVTATVTDANGNAVPGVTVRFSVTGANSASGTGTSPTDANGQATFCYSGAVPGGDVISAYADTNDDNVQEANEPSGTAAKEWGPPQSTPGCKVTDGGRITAANRDKATFGSVAKVSTSGAPSGAQDYQDHGAAANLDVHATAVLAVACSGNKASVFGTATVNGSGSVNYRIDLTDNGEPGVGVDKYRIRLSTGYDSGEQTLIGGNIQLH